MSVWNTWLRQPQMLGLRKAIFQIHLWTGLAIGVYVVVICLSGSVLVYRNELYGMFQPTPDDRAPLGFRATAWLLDFHDNLLGGETGRRTNGVAAALVLLSALTGLLVWWPGVQQWRRSLVVDVRASWRQFNWNLHSALGMWFAVFVLMWGITGLYLSYPKPFDAVVEYLQPFDEFHPVERAGDRVLFWLGYAHFGRFGGRIPGCGFGTCNETFKAIWALVGLVPVVMAVTGAIMWWNRRGIKTVRRWRYIATTLLTGVLVAMLLVAGCRQTSDRQADAPAAGQTATQAVPGSLAMGGRKSVTTFFVTSRGVGRGGDLGGLAGADAHCQMLATAEGSGDHTWRAYLSASATPGQPAVNARDRIGKGPWYNAGGTLIAANVEQLHSSANTITKETAVTERLDPVNGAGDTPNMHDMLTGSRPDGTAFPPGDDLTCGNWTSSTNGRGQVGHHDRTGQGDGAASWNSAHPSRGCSQADLQSTGGAGLFYCFGVD